MESTARRRAHDAVERERRGTTQGIPDGGHCGPTRAAERRVARERLARERYGAAALGLAAPRGTSRLYSARRPCKMTVPSTRKDPFYL